MIDREMTKEDALAILDMVAAVPKNATWEVDTDWGLWRNRGMFTVKAYSNAKYETIRRWFKLAGMNINSYVTDGENGTTHWVEFYRVTPA